MYGQERFVCKLKRARLRLQQAAAMAGKRKRRILERVDQLSFVDSAEKVANSDFRGDRNTLLALRSSIIEHFRASSFPCLCADWTFSAESFVTT
jgi:hypothetical protein